LCFGWCAFCTFCRISFVKAKGGMRFGLTNIAVNEFSWCLRYTLERTVKQWVHFRVVFAYDMGSIWLLDRMVHWCSFVVEFAHAYQFKDLSLSLSLSL
jgi:hypothetical protein